MFQTGRCWVFCSERLWRVCCCV